MILNWQSSGSSRDPPGHDPALKRAPESPLCLQHCRTFPMIPTLPNPPSPAVSGILSRENTWNSPGLHQAQARRPRKVPKTPPCPLAGTKGDKPQGEAGIGKSLASFPACPDVGMRECGNDAGIRECGNPGMRECGNDVGMRESGNAARATAVRSQPQEGSSKPPHFFLHYSPFPAGDNKDLELWMKLVCNNELLFLRRPAGAQTSRGTRE